MSMSEAVACTETGKTLNDILDEVCFLREDGKAGFVMGNVLIDPRMFNVPDEMPFSRAPEHYRELGDFMEYTGVRTTADSIGKQVVLKRGCTRIIKSARSGRKNAKVCLAELPDVVGDLARTRISLGRLKRVTSKSVHAPANPELYDALAGIVYDIADTRGIGTSSRCRENVVASALYSSLFEEKPVNIVTRDRFRMPRLLGECVRFLKLIGTSESSDCLRKHFYTMVGSDIIASNREYNVTVFAPAERNGNGSAGCRYIPCSVHYPEKPADSVSKEKVRRFANIAFIEYMPSEGRKRQIH